MKQSRLTAVALVSLLLFIGCGGGSAATSGKSLRLGYFPNVTHATAIVGVADALRATSSKLKEPGPLPAIAERAANTIDRVAEFVDQRSLRDVATSIESYARRQPAMFVGGAFALGLLAGRFLKSSASNRVTTSQGDSHDAGYE